MKTPKKKEVVKYFENAETISCAYTKNEYKTIELSKPYYGKIFNDCICADLKDGTQVSLYDNKKGYAKILSYKEPKEKTYKITKTQLEKLHRQGNDYTKFDIEYLFPEVFETKLPNYFTGWVLDEKYPKVIAYSENGFLKYGFDANGNWIEGTNTKLLNEREATEQEVTEALKNEAVRRGYNTDKPTHFNYKNGTGYLQNPSKSDFWFRDGILYLWDIKIFDKGQWAEILETISKEDAEKQLNKKIV